MQPQINPDQLSILKFNTFKYRLVAYLDGGYWTELPAGRVDVMFIVWPRRKKLNKLQNR